MSAALKWHLVSVEDYLAGELIAPIKHEYVGGVLHAMAGARVSHNDITTNILVALGTRLRGTPCKLYTSDMKIRIELGRQYRFSYPDVSTVCESNPKSDSFQDKPKVIFEVLSKDTRRTDTGEKHDAYLTIPSLNAYNLVEQESALVVVFRRTRAGFEREVFEELDAVIPLAEIATELPLSEIYMGVEFAPEPEDE